MSAPSDPRRLAPALSALLGLFVLRVDGQALVAFAGVDWLPPMAQWYSGPLAYPVLLLFRRFHRARRAASEAVA